jgi:hypothetical protein
MKSAHRNVSRATLSGRNREGQSTGVGALADSPVVAVIRLRIAVGWGAKGRAPG